MKKDDFDLVEIGKRMKIVRARLRKTQAAMASDLGISLSHYSKLEVGIGGMSHGLIYTFCRTFDVDQDWFVTGQGELPKNITDPRPAKSSSSVESHAPAVDLDKELEKIIELAESENVSKLAEQISQATQIPKTRAKAVLIKELLLHPEKIEENKAAEEK